MPGRVLVFDPIFTNRIMLKAQLSIDFLDVTLAADAAELQKNVRLGKPDVILVSYQADRTAAFETTRWLKSNEKTAYSPIVFLHNSKEDDIWDQSHDLMVEDVLHYRAEKWLMTTGLGLLIRAKERIDGLLAQHKTISDMGFAEQSLCFHPALYRAIRIDVSGAAATFDAASIARLTDILKQDFPNIRLLNSAPDDDTQIMADLHIIDPKTLGIDAAFAKMIELRRTEGPHPPSTMFVRTEHTKMAVARALEFSASDVIQPHSSPFEMANRMRRILWHHDMAHHAEQAVSKHLQSALRDPLTGLYNRRYAHQQLSRLISDPSLPKTSVTAMVIDLDRFKTINDTFGHLTGDSVIRQAAQRLKNNLRPADLVARLGGEEFLVVMKNTSIARVRQIAERLRSEIASKSFMTECGRAIHVSASIGVSATRTTWASSDHVIDCVDIALYRAKDAGRDRVTYTEQAA
jgi:two-component system cell cycle response regulator